MTTLYRYSRWDGTQQIEPFTVSDLMDHIADRMLDEGDLRSILRDLMQRGADLDSGRRMPGLRDLLERLRDRRQQQLQRYNLDSVMDDIRQQLDKVLETERNGIQKRLDEARPDSSGPRVQGSESGRPGNPEPQTQNPGPPPAGSRVQGSESAPNIPEPKTQNPEPPPDLLQMLENMAQKHLQQLDRLPDGVGGKIQALREYDFMDQEARQQFDDLLNSLRKQVMESYFEGLKQALGGMTPELMGQMQQMVRDLNELLERHRQGDDSGFQDFMKKWGKFFPDGIENPEQLAEHIQRSMAQMQSLLDSMTPEMRRELEQMAEQLFQDGALQRDLARLMANLDRMFPDEHGEPLPFSGDEPLTLQEAMRLMNDMHGLDELEESLTESVRVNDASTLDLDEISRLMGEEGRRMAEEIQQFMRMLEEAGFIRRNGKEWSLTPRAMKRIGERALEEIFGRIDRGLAGEHTLSRYGWGVERLDEAKRYSFGDAFALDANRTILNALFREASGGELRASERSASGARHSALRLHEDDFEVWRQSSINQCTTVIMLDMSYSMLWRGRFEAGRKVALALDSLIRSKFPRDELHVTAFSYFVLPLEAHQLLESYWIDPRGTDFPEALRQGRNILAKRKGGTKQIILITDGEPHANSAGWYDGPWSMRQAMEETLKEVQKCSREGITVNTFMLDTEPVMTRFIRTMTKINQGRVFFADPRQLGEYLIVDYVKNRRRAA